MHNAFLFPGQGSQYVGMGEDIFNQSPAVQETYNSASDILGFNLQDISFGGPETRLKETQFTQPAIFVHSVVVNTILKEKDIQPHAVAGHSLGEFSALVSAGVLEFDDALKIVKVRSTEMANTGKTTPGTMAAILGVKDDQLDLTVGSPSLIIGVILIIQIESLNNHFLNYNIIMYLLA